MSVPTLARHHGYLEGVGGLRLHYRTWEPAGPRAAALVVHDLGEHGGRYAPLAERLAGHGFVTVAPDLRGAGDSPGPDDPAAYSVAGWVDDVLALLDERGLERPVLVGASRKRFLGDLLASADGTLRRPAGRDAATAAVSAISANAGAWGVRVHDVGTTRDALAVRSRWREAS